MKRVYYHYSECEEFRPGGMWRIVSSATERERFANSTAELMRDVPAFRESMLRVLDEWPKSCWMNLSSSSTNHQAWFGHAGCFLETGSPEDCTRQGWHRLTLGQQELANDAADEVIAEWHCRVRVPQGQLTLSTYGPGWPD